MNNDCIVIKIRLFPPAHKGTCQVELRVEDPDGTENVPAYSSCIVDSVKHRELVHDAFESGKLLASGLFSGDVATSFDTALRDALNRRRPARVVLEIPTGPYQSETTEEWHSEWHGYRWETLWCKALSQHLTTDQKVYFVRHLPSDGRRIGARHPEHLRALVAVANPPCLAERPKLDWNYDPAPGISRDNKRVLHPIQIAEEVDRAKVALGSLGHVAVLNEEIDPFSLAELVEAINEVKPHVLYLVAHGLLNRAGTHLLIGKSRESVAASACPAGELVTALNGMVQLPRLVVLASCASAGNATGDEGVLAALGPMLAAIGVPAVLAMQGDVRVSTTAEFLPKFFSALAADGRIDRAVSVARHHAFVSQCSDFWAPVLFTRLSDARLWIEREPPSRSGVRTNTQESNGSPPFRVSTTPELRADTNPTPDASDRRANVIDALKCLPSLRNPRTFRRVLDDVPWYGLSGLVDQPNAIEQLADAWLRNSDQLGALLEVLDDFEGPDSKPLSVLYKAVQEITQLPIPWPRLAELKRLFHPEFVIPAAIRREFQNRYSGFRPEFDFPGRQEVHAWLDRLARLPLTPQGGGPLYDFLALLSVRKVLDDGVAPQVEKWRGATPVHAWPASTDLPGTGSLIVVIRSSGPAKFTVWAWVEINSVTTRLDDPSSTGVKWEELSELFPGLLKGAYERCRIPADRLRIEVFLPFYLLTTDIDSWSLAGGTLGEQHQVVLRSYERAYECDEGHELIEHWRHRWDQSPAPGQPLDQNQLGVSWQELNQPNFTVLAADSPPQPPNLGELILAGYPVALIPRAALGGRETAIADLVLGTGDADQSPAFEELPERVRTARRDRDHPAGTVSVLWDDPDRKPPNRRAAFVQPE